MISADTTENNFKINKELNGNISIFYSIIIDC